VLKAFFKEMPFGISVMLIILAIGFVYIALPVFGNSALIVRSGSMQSAIGVGDLAVVKKQADANYKVGDIIAFKNANNSKTLTTHRLAGLVNQDGKVFYQTKGDANKTVDRELVSPQNIIGKAYLRLPYLGKLIVFTKTSAGFSLAVIFPALLVIAFEIQNIFKEIRKQKTISGRQPSKNPETQLIGPIIDVLDFSPLQSRNKLRFKFPGLRVLLPLLASTLLAYSSFAFFSDTETSTGNVFTAAESFGPEPGDVVINEVMWQGSDDEWIELRNTTGHTIDISQWEIANAASGSNPIQISPSTTISSGGFYLIAENKNSSTINVDPDQTTASVSLLDGGEVLILKTTSDQTIDTAFTGSGWFISSSTPRKSVERVNSPGDGTQASQWQVATTHTNMDGATSNDEFGTPKAANGI